MSSSQRPPLSSPEFMQRLAVTLAALAAYRLGAYVPLAGMNPTRLASLYRDSPLLASLGPAGERFSVVGLGLTPIISVLLLLETARLLSPRFNAWAAATANNTRRLEWYAFVAAALLAAVQAYGIATGLEAVPDLVVEPGLGFRAGIVATLVAGAALLMWLATMISQYGLGSGIWLLLLATQLADPPLLVLTTLEFLRTGVIPAAFPVALLVCTVAAVAALVALGLTLQRMGRPLDRTLIWPFYIASFPAGALIALPWILPDGPMWDGLVDLLSPGAPFYLAAVAAIVIAVSLAQWRRTEPQSALAETSAPAESSGASPILVTALALAALAVVPSLLATSLNVRIPIDGRWIAVLVAVALPIADMLRREPG
jgi:preprotein translocase subunit SecY